MHFPRTKESLSILCYTFDHIVTVTSPYGHIGPLEMGKSVTVIKQEHRGKRYVTWGELQKESSQNIERLLQLMYMRLYTVFVSIKSNTKMKAKEV